MELQTHSHRTTTIAERTVRCAFCHSAIPLQSALQTRGVCRLCLEEIAELGWRTVYDRDRSVGEIPANLKAAYKL